MIFALELVIERADGLAPVEIKLLGQGVWLTAFPCLVDAVAQGHAEQTKPEEVGARSRRSDMRVGEAVYMGVRTKVV